MGPAASAVDMYERDNDTVVEIELPGMEKKDIQVAVSDDTLTIEGERKAETAVKEDYSCCERPIPLPVDDLWPPGPCPSQTCATRKDRHTSPIRPCQTHSPESHRDCGYDADAARRRAHGSPLHRQRGGSMRLARMGTSSSLPWRRLDNPVDTRWQRYARDGGELRSCDPLLEEQHLSL